MSLVRTGVPYLLTSSCIGTPPVKFSTKKENPAFAGTYKIENLPGCPTGEIQSSQRVNYACAFKVSMLKLKVKHMFCLKGVKTISTPNPTHIFHITHIKNLITIINSGGLNAWSTMNLNNMHYTNIAHQTIQDQRATTHVVIPPYGTLHDYVPFYFAPLSPMLYSIYRGNVSGYSDGQSYIIYLVSSAQIVASHGLPYIFTDGHGIMFYTNFYNNLNDLDNVDWEIMRAKYWADTEDDLDRKRRRQAEFLVHRFFPWQLINQIVVINNKMASMVKSTLDSYINTHKPPIYVKPQWYY